LSPCSTLSTDWQSRNGLFCPYSSWIARLRNLFLLLFLIIVLCCCLADLPFYVSPHSTSASARLKGCFSGRPRHLKPFPAHHHLPCSFHPTRSPPWWHRVIGEVPPHRHRNCANCPLLSYQPLTSPLLRRYLIPFQVPLTCWVPSIYGLPFFRPRSRHPRSQRHGNYGGFTGLADPARHLFVFNPSFPVHVGVFSESSTNLNPPPPPSLLNLTSQVGEILGRASLRFSPVMQIQFGMKCFDEPCRCQFRSF